MKANIRSSYILLTMSLLSAVLLISAYVLYEYAINLNAKSVDQWTLIEILRVSFYGIILFSLTFLLKYNYDRNLRNSEPYIEIVPEGIKSSHFKHGVILRWEEVIEFDIQQNNFAKIFHNTELTLYVEDNRDYLMQSGGMLKYVNPNRIHFTLSKLDVPEKEVVEKLNEHLLI